MVPSSGSCAPLKTKKDASWPYYEYFLGSKDQQKRRNGVGQNYWTGAESMEWYTGHFTRDTMHGTGEYFCRYRGRRALSATYEGNFYVNRMHGYGAMSYPDGKVFTGLFNNNVRYGPGIESFPNRHANVGLWRGPKLVRLAWRPSAPSVAPELHVGPICRSFVEPHRVVLNTTYKTIGKSNSAIELLKECGSEPIAAAENWTRLYPKCCTDTASQLCQVELFENEYYNGKIYSLQRSSDLKNNEDLDQDSRDSFEDVGPYYAWNNNEMAIDMMKHCFKHERQRNQTRIDLATLLTGPRKHFLLAGIHELDCRTLLMATYLGHIASTTYLINERCVDPNIADMQGNSAIIYATCGDQKEIIDFLTAAGANVDSYNDSCCTALGIALMRLICSQKDISISAVAQAMLPPPTVPPAPIEEPRAFEWHIIRDLPPPNVALGKSPSRITKLGPDKSVAKKEKSATSLKDTNKKKPEPFKPMDEIGYESDESINEENKLYKDINNEYVIKVSDIHPTIIPPLYLFDVNDMVKDLDFEEKVVTEKNPKKQISKVLKETTKPSKEVMWQNFEGDEDASLSSLEKSKAETLERIKATILQLLDEGANPNLVKYPQSALFMAITTGYSDLVQQLLKYGANVNEVYSEAYNYTILDIAVSRPMTYDNLEIIRALLEGGARPDHRLRFVLPAPPNNPELEEEIPGPTLLHAVLARKVESEIEEEIRKQLMELLLEYNCDVLTQFKGRSPFDIATRSMDLLDIVVRSPKTNLNAIINDQGQTILVKMFHLPYFKTIDSNDRLQTLTNLLLFGADPLLECQNGDTQFKNLFVMAKNTLLELESAQGGSKGSPTTTAKKEPPKKEEKAKAAVGAAKSTGKMVIDGLGNYRQAIDLITECARILHIRWLQGKLTKELVKIIDTYKHRHWNIILGEHKRKKPTGLWLPAQRCLEIWDLLKTTKRRIYNDKRTLKHLLCIVYFYNLRSKMSNRYWDSVKCEERNIIEYEVNCMIREHKKTTNFEPDMLPLQRLYVQPELFAYADSEFDVCFECALPLEEERIQCQLCKLVSFCDLECIRMNIDRTSCHPCSDYFKKKYFPSPPTSNDTTSGPV
ncbi:ankyrin repeat and MYND domain-containing protein 1-like isoform X2 [Choristoneura fumiferana]|uniref:ankyrin repeat and MYND domain-containing protein 1-like isoform X2 n=1 Tax=Choristoneura fumiferana TaxID=7141 RepID=UPI003D15ADA7